MTNNSHAQNSMAKHLIIYFGVSVVILILDLWSKSAATANLDYAVPVPVYTLFDALTGFNLTLLHNTGAAFSFLASESGWQRWFFTLIAISVSGVLCVWLMKLKEDEKWLAAALSLVIGGALGNLYDRLAYGHVVDFIHVHWGPSYFPAFNIADSSISIAAGLLIYDFIIQTLHTTLSFFILFRPLHEVSIT